jgi:hypothetical protein
MKKVVVGSDALNLNEVACDAQRESEVFDVHAADRFGILVDYAGTVTTKVKCKVYFSAMLKSTIDAGGTPRWTCDQTQDNSPGVVDMDPMELRRDVSGGSEGFCWEVVSTVYNSCKLVFEFDAGDPGDTIHVEVVTANGN